MNCGTGTHPGLAERPSWGGLLWPHWDESSGQVDGMEPCTPLTPSPVPWPYFTAEYNQLFKLNINRNHRGFRRAIRSKGIKFEVFHKGWVQFASLLTAQECWSWSLWSTTSKPALKSWLLFMSESFQNVPELCSFFPCGVKKGTNSLELFQISWGWVC